MEDRLKCQISSFVKYRQHQILYQLDYNIYNEIIIRLIVVLV